MSDVFCSKSEALIENWLRDQVGYEVFKEKNETYLKLALNEYIKEIKRRNIKIVTIAGTNGKGETAYNLSYLLNKEKIEHTLWISPHVLSIRERVSCNGEQIGYDLMRCLLEEQRRKCEELSIELSYYEFLFCIFLNYSLNYTESKLEIIILEVGIGGKLDAVNYLDTNLAMIVSVSRDHQELLGRYYRDILYEKFCIARENKILLTSLEQDYCQGLVQNWVNHFIKATWFDLFTSKICQKKDSFRIRNQYLALTALVLLKNYDFQNNGPVDRDLLKESLLDIRDSYHFPLFPGRMETLTFGSSQLVFAGSHNLDGFRKLIGLNIDQNEKFDLILAAFSKRFNNEEFLMIKQLIGYQKKCDISRIYLTEFDHFKALKFDSDLCSMIGHNESCSISWLQDWKNFLLNLKVKSSRVLVTGSYYFVGEVQKFCKNDFK